MSTILNLTQHPASEEQRQEGVVDFQGEELTRLKALLTFNEPPTRGEISQRAVKIADLVNSVDFPTNAVMLGGAPYLMPALERVLTHRGIVFYYAFSRRESVEQTQPDGSVRKVNVFRHVGWV